MIGFKGGHELHESGLTTEVAGALIAAVLGVRSGGSFLIGFSVLMPVANAMMGIAIARLLGTGPGDALLFAVLCASASCIAVPAARQIDGARNQPKPLHFDGASADLSV
ncbi:MAG: sodium-dependent bicarbonate transport family permease [Phormidesmis sp.]